MDALAESLGTAGKWLVIVGGVMFVAGFLLDVFTVANKEAGSATSILIEIIRKAFKIAFDSSRPPGQRMSAAGLLLVGLGLVSMLGGLAIGAAAGSGAGGSSSSPSPTGSSASPS